MKHIEIRVDAIYLQEAIYLNIFKPFPYPPQNVSSDLFYILISQVQSINE